MTISLPATWIKKFNLKEGDELEINESGNNLELSASQSEDEEQKAILTPEEVGYFSKNDLTHYYMLGYDEVVIHFKDPNILKDIKDRVPECIGYEIIDQTENKIVVKSISSALENEFDNILRKVFLILKEMAKDTHDALNKKEFERLSQIRELEHINNKFCVFLLRVISKKGYKIYKRSLQAYDLIQNLERIADEYKYICDDYINSKKEINKESLELLNKVNEFYNTFFEMFKKYDPELKSELHNKNKELKQEIEKIILNNDEPILSYHLMKILEKVNNAKGSYLALIIDH